jgi:anti-anti-sigma regulatory factor
MFTLQATNRGLAASGALDAQGARILLDVLRHTHDDVWLDASRIHRLDGAGLTALAVVRSECRSEGREFVVSALPPEACRDLRVGTTACRLFAAGR